MPPLDHDLCYAAASSRDERFDGRFVVAVRTTGIYCRPSCPAITPKRTNVEFHHTAAAAQQRGFRACKRCLPDATPGSPEWNTRNDVVARAMRLIADGVVERDGVGGVASRLGYSERHLHRLLADEVGAGPLAIARAQRAQTSRTLIETTDLTLTDVAFAAGFGSVRQFNDTIRDVFDATPSELRTSAHGRRRRTAPASFDARAPVTVGLRLPARTPFASTYVIDFVAQRCVPGVESVRALVHDSPSRCDPTDPHDPTARVTYSRLLNLPGGPGAVSMTAADDHVRLDVRVVDWADLATAVQRVRRLLDLDADPVAVDAHLAASPPLARLVEAAPGLRSPGSVDPFETLVRAIIGQQISVAGARTVTGRLVEAIGPAADPELTTGWDGLARMFPGPAGVADAPDGALPMPRARRDTIRRAAAAVADGRLVLDAGADADDAREQLLAIKGIGPWTADYVLMRGLGHPDVMLDTDLGVIHARRHLGCADAQRLAAAWAPWRSYAVHHLWRSLPTAGPDRTRAADRRLDPPREDAG